MCFIVWTAFKFLTVWTAFKLYVFYCTVYGQPLKIFQGLYVFYCMDRLQPLKLLHYGQPLNLYFEDYNKLYFEDYYSGQLIF